MGAGRVRSFTDDEIEVLRNVARRLKTERQWSGRQLGEAIGIAQQNAGRFVAAGSTAGMDRTTANKLAIVAGYRDVEHLLLDAGVLATLQPKPEGAKWDDRDFAVRLAHKLGYSQEVTDAVVHRFSAHEYTSRKARWWNDQFVLESLARAADKPIDPPPASSPAPVLGAKKPDQKTAGNAVDGVSTNGDGAARQRKLRTGTLG